MKVVCISNKTDLDEFVYTNITKGKTYNVDNELITLYWIEEDDNGNKRGIPTYLFITIEEYREQQLNKILQ